MLKLQQKNKFKNLFALSDICLLAFVLLDKAKCRHSGGSSARGLCQGPSLNGFLCWSYLTKSQSLRHNPKTLNRSFMGPQWANLKNEFLIFNYIK